MHSVLCNLLHHLSCPWPMAWHLSHHVHVVNASHPVHFTAGFGSRPVKTLCVELVICV